MERGTNARKKRKKFVHLIHKVSLLGFKRRIVIRIVALLLNCWISRML